MAFRDRFYTPSTAKAILSWRILLGVGVGVVSGLIGLPVGAAIALGAVVYVGSVAQAMPKPATPPSVDPFTLSEPWRQLMRNAQKSGRKMRETVAGTPSGPLRDMLQSIADQLERGLDEAWAVAKRGDEIDDNVRRLDPTAMRSKLATLRQRAATDPSPDADSAVESVERQLASADRLKQRSSEIVASLRLTQTRLDELVARASEVWVDTFDTDTYANEVDELVIKLEALHQAVQETRTS